MKMRKLFASIAAAATMMAGLAFGAATANAAPADQTLTLNAGSYGVVDGHTFKYVELASYLGENSGEIETVADRDAVVTAIRTATGADVPSDVDPLVWAQSGDLNGTGSPLFGDNSAFPWSGNDASREFANALVSYAETNGVSVTADAEPFTITGLDGGLYLLVDVTEGATATEKSLPIIVGTANTAVSMTGEINVKNQKTDVPPTKSVEGDTDGTVSVGDTLTYTINGMVPSTTDQSDDYVYSFVDYASAGLSINTSKSNVKVYVEGESEPLAESEYTVSPADQTVAGDGSNATFTVSLTKAALDNLQDYAGKKLSVKYSATVTDDAKENPVTNSAEIDNGGNASGQGTPVTLHTNKFSFTKVWADGTAATGASFEVFDGDGNSVAKIENNSGNVFEFAGLKNGTYTVRETKVADGAQNVTGSFTVTLKYGEAMVFGDSLTSDPYDLVKYDGESGAITVTNVKSITQLPLTGAAGTALFTAIGLLLAGVAVTVYVKSRGMKRSLNA
ncbi:fimbrial subunit FimA [Bifidobacterium lemurum]|uniref:Fimbrial subunit FimA n=1 Tax=Bifidobacterium lemurum TaxID=1603886 RepID=A0A261FSI1_9BIFI|nr:SpaH/EbpB family LPXTG-anchored major pilin [Bifidobacterium lemurum]OZG61935.1 fimbrial subunit FimA [Bifidobacterium lemurum]QOL35285.1 SpaH/EbpB family LPXTG-anchored major pilin [Bifidobacterium lemurum]